jgi:hypothetical protein
MLHDAGSRLALAPLALPWHSPGTELARQQFDTWSNHWLPTTNAYQLSANSY